jgi:probable F420-dependent oxidoreductase
LSDGRFVLGVGAGHAEIEFRQAGLRYPSAPDRVTKLERAVGVLQRLVAGESVDDDMLGLAGAATGIGPAREHLPLLVDGIGHRVLSLAGRMADAAGVVGFVSGTGQVHTNLTHWTWDGLANRIAVIRSAATGRDFVPGTDLLIQRVVVTNDRDRAANELAEASGIDASRHLDSPFLLLGTETEIADQLRRLSTDFGVSAVTVFVPYAEALAPIIEQMRAERRWDPTAATR